MGLLIARYLFGGLVVSVEASISECRFIPQNVGAGEVCGMLCLPLVYTRRHFLEGQAENGYGTGWPLAADHSAYQSCRSSLMFAAAACERILSILLLPVMAVGRDG